MSSSNFIHKQSNEPPKIRKIILPAVLAVVIIGAGGFWYFTNKSGDVANTRDDAQITSSKDKINNSSSGESHATESNPEKAPEDVSNKTTDQIPTDESISVTLLSQTQANGLIKVSARITGSNEGKCVFTFTTEGDRPVVRESKPNNSTCSAEIPEVEFTKLGSLNLNISFFSKNTRAEVNQSVTIN